MTTPANTPPPATDPAASSDSSTTETTTTDVPDLKAVLADALAPFLERLTKLEGKQTQLGKDLGRARAKVRKVAGEDVTSEPADGGEGTPAQDPDRVTRDEVMAGFKLGTVLAGLPEAARGALQEAVDAGDMTFTDALERALFLQANLPASGKDETNQGAEPPRGKPASGPRSTGTPQITTQAQYLALKAKDPDQAFELVRRGEIDVANLKAGPTRPHPLLG